MDTTTQLYDQEYFRERTGLEEKHFYEALYWCQCFKPKKVIELGCGLGHRLYALHYIGIDVEGCDLEYPITNTPYHEIKERLRVGVVTEAPYVDEAADLVICYDVLEHLATVQDVEKALQELYRISSKHVVISVPVIGDPNLEADKTHRIKKTMQWWEYKVTEAGFRLLPKPNNVPFREQMIWLVK